MQVNEIIALQPISSLKPSKDIHRDKDLPWDEMIMAKNMMLHFITKSGVWQKEHIHSLVAFFVVLKNHPMHYWELGNKTILHYISRVHQEWFNALKRNEGFNLQLINEDLMQQIVDEVKDTARAEELHEVSIFCNLVKLTKRLPTILISSLLFYFMNHYFIHPSASPITICYIITYLLLLFFMVHYSNITTGWLFWGYHRT